MLGGGQESVNCCVRVCVCGGRGAICMTAEHSKDLPFLLLLSPTHACIACEVRGVRLAVRGLALRSGPRGHALGPRRHAGVVRSRAMPKELALSPQLSMAKLLPPAESANKQEANTHKQKLRTAASTINAPGESLRPSTLAPRVK